MDRFGPPTWYRAWQRGQAMLVLAAFAAMLLFLCWPAAPAVEPSMRASNSSQSDAGLYRVVIGRVAHGDGYYQAMAQELRRGHYPLRPFITFRLPTHAVIYARLGERVMVMLQALLAGTVLFLWWRRLGPGGPLWLYLVALLALGIGLVGMLQPVTGLFQEDWAGLLIALSIAARRPGGATLAILAGGAALLVRETALPMVVMMGVAAFAERRRREALGWAVVLALFAIYLGWHATQVAAVVAPTDLQSPGWAGLLGPGFALKAIAATTGLTLLPPSLASALLILSLFGWASVATGWAVRGALIIFGYGLMLALFARADTFYWALLASPLAVMGLAFVPAALRDLAAALDLAPRRVACSAS